jgi:hypothetical protein
MIGLASDVLRHRPEVSLGLAARHPVILVDEYQDCDEDQHVLIQQIAAAAPTRLRLFGDDLQAIYDFDGVPVDFAAMIERSPTVRLSTPWRWRDQMEMAAFVVEARRALVAGNPVDLTDPPGCVTVASYPSASAPLGNVCRRAPSFSPTTTCTLSVCERGSHVAAATTRGPITSQRGSSLIESLLQRATIASLSPCSSRR